MQVRTDAVCPLCQEDEETVLHLLGECSALFAECLSIRRGSVLQELSYRRESRLLRLSVTCY